MGLRFLPFAFVFCLGMKRVGYNGCVAKDSPGNELPSEN